MGLEYRVLWIENDSDWQSSTEEMIKDEISELGYILKTTFYEDYSVFIHDTKKTDDFKMFDLILVDFKLDNDLTGDSFIEKVRDNNVFTDVLFYSQNSDELQELFSKISLEGVYISNREDFEDKFFQVFRKIIKKFEELNAIRGLVMAETSRLDRIIEDILISFFESSDKEKDTLIKYIIDKIKSSLKGNFKGDNLKIESKSHIEIVKSRIFDTDKKSQALMKLIKLKDFNKINFVHEKYKEDVLKIRNDLAHAKSIIKNDIEYLIIEEAGTTNEKELKQEDFIKIRKNIIKYDEILNSVITKIKTPSH